MRKRLSGEIPTLDTRADSHELVDKNKRYKQIIECLDTPKTAKECAVTMMEKGYIPTSERNYTAPRITELLHKGVLDQVGTKKCEYTGRTVTVFEVRDNG